MKQDIKKVVLAYSGGLDTSVILKWLQEAYACEVVTFTADLGQGEEIEIARETGAEAVSHGATGKGNDQVRFELAYYALNPDIKVIAPWREWDLDSRTKLIEFAEKHQIPIARDKRGEAPFSVDSNLLHTSSEGKALEDPWQAAGEFVYSRTVAPEDAPDKATIIEIGFETGDAVSIDGKALSPAAVLDDDRKAERD